MSKYSKKTLAVALVAALMAPAAAFAFQVQTNGDTTAEAIAIQAGNDVTMAESVDLVVQIRDVIIGRTTGFQLLVSLEDGAQFGDQGATLALSQGAGLQGEWTIALAAGGNPGESDAVFTVAPDSANATVSVGTILQFEGLVLENVRTTGPTRMSVQINDPVGGNQLQSSTQEIITRTSGLAVTCDPTNPADRIDVGGEFPKARFVSFEDGGYAIGAGEETTTSLGTISLAASAGFEFTADTTVNSEIVGNFAGFDRVFWATDATCAVEIPDSDYTFNDARTLATLEIDGFTGANVAGNLCVTVDGETQIAAQTFNVRNGVNGAFAGSVCNVAPLQYNGSVVNVYHVNPAGNTTAQSFVRVINPSNIGGRVTIVGIDDAGNRSNGSVSFDLPSGASMQVNSEDLENGNAGKMLAGSLGDGVGKWRLEVTGEFQGMLVQGLNRNTTNGTITNLTDADAEVEQRQLHRGNSPL